MGSFVIYLVWASVLCGYDICFRRLPNWLTLPGFVVIAFSSEKEWLLGGIVWAGVYAMGKGIGGGDVKLALGLGILATSAGWIALWLAITLSSFGSLLVGVASKQKKIPHGPAMIGSTTLVLQLGAALPSAL